MNATERRRLKRNANGTGHNLVGGCQGEWKDNTPTVRFWGLEAAEEYVDKLTNLLGPGCEVHTTETFCCSNACSAAEIPTILKRDWIAHNIQRVERREEKAGLFPFIMIEGAGPIYSISLYSASGEVREELNVNMANTNGLSYDDLVQLSRILGGPDHAVLVEEEEFCDTVGCSLEQIKEHLSEHWVEHDIGAVLAGLEFVPEPTVVLVSQRPGVVTWHLITQRDAKARQRCLEINELSRLYAQDSEQWHPKEPNESAS